MNVNLFTVFLMVGPSGCGKSYFSKNKLIPALRNKSHNLKEPLRISYLSSDEIRQDILGYPFHKLSQEMMGVSKDAFDILIKRLYASTTYPATNHFVVVDTTGLDEHFRSQVKTVCEKNNYHLQVVVFNYDDKSLYYQEKNIKQKEVTDIHLKKLEKNLPLIKEKHGSVLVIKDLNDPVININLENYNSCLRDHDKPFTIVGDIHGCYSYFLKLLERLSIKVIDGKITYIPDSVGTLVLIGDIIDKGPDSELMINFVFNNLSSLILIRGNHENFVLREIKSSQSVPLEVKQKYFDSIYTLSTEAKEKLKKIYESSFDFIKTNLMVICHSPCENKYLTKTDSKSIKLMRKSPYMRKYYEFEKIEDYQEYLDKQFIYLKDEANKNHPLHIFGHMSFDNVFKNKNKFGIDSGAVYGGFLSALTVNPDGSTKTTQIKTKIFKEYSPFGILSPLKKV